MSGLVRKVVRGSARGHRSMVPAVAAALVVACCATGTGALAQSATQPASPATTLSLLTPGESWSWELTGTLTPAGSSQALPLTGTQNQDVELLPFQGRPTLALVATQNLSAGGMSLFGSQPPPAAIFYVQQDPVTNTVYSIGDNQSPDGSTRVSLQPAEFTPGQWSSTAGYDSLLSFASGETERLLLNVTGTTTVTTPLGDFAAWISPTNAIDSTGVTHPGTDYWTPEIGAPALFETATTLPDGSAIQITGRLTQASILNATSVPEPASLALLGCGLLGLAAMRRRSA